MGSEKRKDVRMDCYLPAQYWLVLAMGRVAQDSKKSTITNLSGGGCCMLVNDEMPKGTKMYVQFRLGLNEEIKIFCDVLRAEEAPRGYSLGIRFLDREGVKERIIKYVFFELRKKRKEGSD